MSVGVRGHRIQRARGGRRSGSRRLRRDGQSVGGRRSTPARRLVLLQLVGRPLPLPANGTVPGEPVVGALEQRRRLPNGVGARLVRSPLLARRQNVRAQPRRPAERVHGHGRRSRRVQAGRIRSGHQTVGGRHSRRLGRRPIPVPDGFRTDQGRRRPVVRRQGGPAPVSVVRHGNGVFGRRRRRERPVRVAVVSRGPSATPAVRQYVGHDDVPGRRRRSGSSRSDGGGDVVQ